MQPTVPEGEGTDVRKTVEAARILGGDRAAASVPNELRTVGDCSRDGRQVSHLYETDHFLLCITDSNLSGKFTGQNTKQHCWQRH